jgi:predicted O-linked N-acetylglucosamine transferase (SPINDLY family)
MTPTAADRFDNMIFCLDHAEGTTPEKALTVRREWWTRYGQEIHKLAKPIEDHDRDPERPLRVGYISGDFKSHSASFLFSLVALRHSPAVQAFGYFTAPAGFWDDWTSIYSQEMTFRHVFGQDGPTIATLIRRDQIDVLVDLAAFSNYGRLDVFCLKPAPVQVTAWGYVLGTGLETMDAIFGDAVTMPRRDQSYFQEQIVHLPCIIPYVGPLYAPDVQPAPVATGEPFTFGVFSRPAKVNPSTLRTWGQIMRAVPGSRMLFKVPLTEHKEYRHQILQGLSIEPHRVMFEGYTPHDKHLAAYHRVDLGLDPYPHGGGVTIAEGLWMGVPHITRTGDRVCNRIGASVYGLLGLDDFIADDEASYIKLARRWATEGKKPLAEWRLRLRAAMFKSPLAQGYVEAVEGAYRELWRAYCKPGGPDA